MTSKLVVNTIEADTGISSVSFASSISMNSTSKFHFSAAGIDIGADTNINRPTSGVLGFNINNTEKLRIDSNGHLNTSGIATASNFKTGSSNLHSTGLTVGNNFLHTTGINVGTGATIHVPATNVLTFGTNSNERLRISSNGLVNIGAGSNASGLSPLLHLHKNASNSTAYLHITNNTTGITNNDGFLLGINGVGDCLVFNKDSTPIRFATAGVERVRIDSSGYLIAKADIRLRRTASDNGAIYFGDTNNNYIFGTDADDVITFATAGSERLRISSGGGILIGSGNQTKTQDGVLIERNSGDGVAHITAGRSGGNYSGINFYVAGASGVTLRHLIDYQSNFKWYAADGTTERLRLTSSGQLFLGETSAFDSNTAIQFRKDVSGNQARFIFRNRANNGNSRVQLQLSTLNRAANADTFSGIEKYQSGGMAIYNGENTNQYSNINFFTNGWRSLQLRNGNHSGAWCAEIDAYWGTSNGLRMEVGGPQSGTWQAIDFHTSHTGTQRGYIGVTYGGVSYNSSSDYRMKQDVVDLTSAIDRVKSLKPKRFRWKEDLTHTVDGFLAHEAQTVVPESVQGEKDGEQMQVMDNSKLVPLLTASLKEAIAKIETLETKVAALEGS